jgi:hypothetical protein
VETGKAYTACMKDTPHVPLRQNAEGKIRQGMSFFCFFKDTHVLGQYLYFCMNKERTKRKLERL